MTTGKALLGVLAGFVAGAALGVLFAPERGSRIRKKIIRKSEDAVDDLKYMLEEKIKDLVETVQTDIVVRKKDDVRKGPEYIPV